MDHDTVQRPINRCLEDKLMDHIDHALGRPLDPMAETCRNYFAVGDGALAAQMAMSPLWTDGWPSHGPGIMRYFHVTKAGRKALVDHLKAIGDKHRAFVINFEGRVSRIIATSRSKARYSYYLDVSDSWPDLTFKYYCSRVSVQAA